jgi:hypothetical protein
MLAVNYHMNKNGIFAICWKPKEGEQPTPLSAKSFKDYWPNYGGNHLYGWRPPKKVYFSLGTAKTGFSHIPDEIKPLCGIYRLSIGDEMADGEVLAKEQADRRQEREGRIEQRRARWDLKKAQESLQEAQRVFQEAQVKLDSSR